MDAVYSVADVDGDGNLDKREMADLLILVSELKDKQVDTEKATAKVEEIFGYYDADKDRFIDKDEFKNVLYYYYYDLQKIKDINVDDLDQAFDYIDRDGDGKIEQDELVEIYVRIYEAERRATLK